MRRVLGIYYPTKITNESLYKKCKETPLSLQILEARWRLFGHILRRDPEIPANKAMTFYFTKIDKPQRGRPTTTLPVTLNNDLKKTKLTKLTTLNDLDEIRNIAMDRRKWHAFTQKVKKTAEAAKSEDIDSGRP